MKALIAPFLSACLTVLVCIFAERLGNRLQIVARPDGNLRRHGRDTPLIGGLAILGPSLLLLSAPIALGLFGAASVLVVATTACLVVGYVDDRWDIPPLWRVVALALIFLLLSAAFPLFTIREFSVQGMDLGFSLGASAIIFTAFVLVGFLNAVNMSDGMNGQLVGSILFWSGMLAFHGGVGRVPYLQFFASATIVALFNLRGKLFLGSCGAYGAASFIALATIASYNRADAAHDVIAPVLWFWLPVLDCLRMIATRLAAGRNPLEGDRDHFHHLLQNVLSRRLALAVYLLLLIAPGLAYEVDTVLALGVLALCTALYGTVLVSRYFPAWLRAQNG